MVAIHAMATERHQAVEVPFQSPGFEPARGFFLVCWDTSTGPVHPAKIIKVRLRVSVAGGKAKTSHCFFVVLFHPNAIPIVASEVTLSDRTAPVRGATFALLQKSIQLGSCFTSFALSFCRNIDSWQAGQNLEFLLVQSKHKNLPQLKHIVAPRSSATCDNKLSSTTFWHVMHISGGAGDELVHVRVSV